MLLVNTASKERYHVTVCYSTRPPLVIVAPA